MNSKNTLNATSSPASEDGRSHCNGQDGQMTGKSGQAPVPVSRFRARDNEKAMPTNDTCGPLFTHSSPSANLQRCLENRLRERMDVNGSPEYVLTWKEQDMPAGPPICALRASGHRIFGKGCSGWPTPNTPSGGRSVDPSKMDATGRTVDGKKHTASLEHAVKFAGWPTAAARDWKDGTQQSCANIKENALLGRVVHQVGWSTLRATDGSHGGPNQAGGALSHDVHTSGPHPSASNAETGKSGEFRLNPRFSLWLMGYPAEWASCGERAMQSCRKSRRNS